MFYVNFFKLLQYRLVFIFPRLLASVLILEVSGFCFLRDHNGNKVYKLFFLCIPYHQLLAIKDVVSFSLVFYCGVYIFETICKIIDGRIYLLIYLLTVGKRCSRKMMT